MFLVSLTFVELLFVIVIDGGFPPFWLRIFDTSMSGFDVGLGFSTLICLLEADFDLLSAVLLFVITICDFMSFFGFSCAGDCEGFGWSVTDWVCW